MCAALFPFLVLPNLYQQFCQVTSSGDVLSGDVLSRQNVSSWLYRQAGTFCPDKMSPLGYIGKRGRFVRTKCPMTKRPRLAIQASGDILSGVILSWGYFVLGTFCLGDILSWGRFVLWTFCLVDILSWGRFVLGTFCPWGHFVRGRFVLGTFCLGDNLSWGQSVKGTFCLGTLCPQGHFLHGDILYMGTFCPVTTLQIQGNGYCIEIKWKTINVILFLFGQHLRQLFLLPAAGKEVDKRPLLFCLRPLYSALLLGDLCSSKYFSAMQL